MQSSQPLVRILLYLCLLPLVTFVGRASAQDTGGSAGGGDWGGGGGGDFDSGGGGFDGGGDFGDGGGAEFPLVALVAIVIPLILAAIPFIWAYRYRRRMYANNTIKNIPKRAVDVCALSIAIDWQARAELQARLAQLAHTVDTATSGGRTRLLHETVISLKRHRNAWLYAGAVNHVPSAKSIARPTFTALAQEMRVRFKHELVRSHDGQTTTASAPKLEARSEEGPGVVVVTLVVAAWGDLPDVVNASDTRRLEVLLGVLGATTAADLVALEVIWSPAAEDDRMSTAELEAIYPELRKVDDRAIGGRMRCVHCNHPYASELTRCPSCGAPAAQARRLIV